MRQHASEVSSMLVSGPLIRERGISWLVDGTAAVMDTLDKNDDGVIDKDELKQVISNSGVPVSSAAVDRMFARADTDNDGVLSSAEIAANVGLCSLSNAILNNDMRGVMNVVYSDETSINEKDTQAANRTLLHKAAAMGSTVSIALLMDSKADLLALDQRGYTPMELAITNGHKDAGCVLAKKMVAELDRRGVDSLVPSDHTSKPRPKSVVCTIL